MASTATSNKRFRTVLAFIVVSTMTSACPPGWKQWNDSCYTLLSSKMTWDEAENACNKLGVNLIVPNSQSEYEYIWETMTEWMKRKSAITPSDLQLWIGCQDVDNTGKMRCQGNQDNSVYQNWKVGEPNNLGDKCIRMTGGYNGQLGDRGCDNKFFVACEMKVELPSTSRSRIAPSSALYIHVSGLCLLNHQIKSYGVKYPIVCGLACWAEPRCHSFNLLKKLDEIICQLSNATRVEIDDVTDITFVNKCYLYEPSTV